MFTVSVFLFAGKGSVYSRYGVGEIWTTADGRYAGMGLAGVASLDVDYINPLNPAASSTLTRSMISANYRFQNIHSQDATGSTTILKGNVNAIALAFPVYTPDKIVLSLGMSPYSSVGYEQQYSSRFDGTVFIQTFDGRGGLSEGHLSLSYSPLTDLYLGIAVRYLFGAIYSDQSITFASSDFFGGSYNTTTSLSGLGVSFGTIVTGIDKLAGLSDEEHLSLGATFFSGSSLTMEDELLRHYSSTIDTITTDGQTMKLPFGFTAGLSYALGAAVYAADIGYENWSAFTVNGVHPPELQNSVRAGAGVEFRPSKGYQESFWDKVYYRIGGYVRQTNLHINGQSINEMFGTAGIGFPVSTYSRMNIGLQYGIRGTTASSLIRDDVFRLMVSVSASELMFIQSPVE